MLLRFGWTGLLVAALVAGCGDAKSAWPGSDAGFFDGSGGGDASLRVGDLLLESDAELDLPPSGMATFQVRAVDPFGAPLAYATVKLTILGYSGDTTLSSFERITALDGRASATVLAGNEPAIFTLRATLEGATPVSVLVKVATDGYVAQQVGLEYTGARAIVSTSLRAYPQGACDDDALLEGPLEGSITVPAGASVGAFYALVEGQSYALVALARNGVGGILAAGCIDGVLAEAEAAPRVLPIADVTAFGDAPFPVALELALDGRHEALSALAASAGVGAIAAGGGDAEVVLDAVDAVLRERGLAAGADAIATLRAQSSLEADVTQLGAGPTPVVDALVAAIDGAPSSFALVGTVVMRGTPWQRSGLAFTPSSVFGVGSNGAPDPALPLSPPVPAVTLSGAFTTGDLVFDLTDASVSLDSAGHVSLLERMLALRAGATTLEAALVGAAASDDVFALPALAPHLAECTASCRAAIEARIVATALDAIRAAWAAPSIAREHVQLPSGMLTLLDEDGDFRLEGLGSPPITGMFVGESDGDLVIATFGSAAAFQP